MWGGGRSLPLLSEGAHPAPRLSWAPPQPATRAKQPSGHRGRGAGRAAVLPRGVTGVVCAASPRWLPTGKQRARVSASRCGTRDHQGHAGGSADARAASRALVSGSGRAGEAPRSLLSSTGQPSQHAHPAWGLGGQGDNPVPFCPLRSPAAPSARPLLHAGRPRLRNASALLAVCCGTTPGTAGHKTRPRQLSS